MQLGAKLWRGELWMSSTSVVFAARKQLHGVGLSNKRLVEITSEFQLYGGMLGSCARLAC